MSLSETLEQLPALARRTFLSVPVKGSVKDEVLKMLQGQVLERVRSTERIEKEK